MVLIGYWPLNETSGTTSYDHSGNENHGTMKNGAGTSGTGTTKAPTGNTAYQFDGNDDYIDGGDSLDVQNDRIFISAWVKASSLSSRSDIVSKGTTDDYQYELDIESNGNITMRSYQAGGTTDFYVNANKVIDDGNWHHIAAYVIENTEGKVYIDGVQDAHVTSNNGSWNKTGSGPFRIGARGDNVRYANGAISEVRVYNQILTSSEIQYLYTVGKQGKLTTNKKQS